MASHSLSIRKKTTRPLAIASLLAIGLSGCSGLPGSDNSAVIPRSAPVVQNLTPDSRGIITYATYQVAVARDGDTMQSVATRVGTSASELASANALPEGYLPRSGEVLLLPASVPRPDGSSGFATGDVSTQPLEWSPESAAAAIDSAGPTASPFQNGQTQPLMDPVRHRVAAGETAYSISRLYGVSVTALGTWNGLDADLTVRENQELLIPIVSDANRISPGSDTQPGQTTDVAAPAAAATPLPEDIAVATDPASPNLQQYRTPAGGKLSAPVSAGVSRGYDASNPNGIGYAVPAGTNVKAAADGEVALISEELGGIGAIVLIRHGDDLMTTYSTLSNVTVDKGDKVSAGQIIGSVANRDKPELQFDVFRGTNSVDPSPYVK